MKRIREMFFVVLTAVLILLPVTLLMRAPVAEALDTVGTYASPNGYNLPNLTEIRWKADIPEYESNTGLLRFEYNNLYFQGPSGGYVGYLAGAIQNLIHQYNEADCFIPTSNILPGLGLYFSTLEDWGGPFKGGVELTANPDVSPRFRRMFQDIDGLSQIGINVYSNDVVGTPSMSQPVTIEWHIKRGEVVTNPTVQVRKDLTCTWTPLVGDYRKWLVDVTIDGTNYPVGTWYLPEVYAQYLQPTTPIGLAQEYFGACNKIGVGYQLPVNKGQVEYYDIRVSSDGLAWTDISNWKLWHSYDGECYKDLNNYTADPSDTRFGMGTIVKNGQKRIITRVGHDNDVSMKHTPDAFFSGISAQPSGTEVTISNALAQRQTNSSATITWNTSLAADSMVRYGTTPNYGSSQYVSGDVSTHTVQLNGLSPNTLYYYRIESIDSTGHIATFDGTISALAVSAIYSPTPASQLGGSTVTFNWTNAAADQYYLTIGNTQGGTDIYGASQGTNLSGTVNNLPTDGRTIYVQLFTLHGSQWFVSASTYTAASNQPPTANVNGPYSGTVGQSIAFSSAGSSDPDGTIVSYAWSFGDGGTATVAAPTHTYAAAGTYTVTLTVTDNVGATGTASTTCTVLAAVSAISSPTPGSRLGGSTVTFNWTNAAADEYYLNIGNTFAGTDIYGASQGTNLSGTVNNLPTDGRTIYVQLWTRHGTEWYNNVYSYTAASNQPPTANVNGPYSGTVGQSIAFSSAGSSDPDGTIASYSWNFGDGGTATVAAPTHSYSSAGTYAVTLTVTDNSGATATASTSATVNPVLPDLLVRANSIGGVPATLAYGTTAPITSTIDNIGGAAAGQFGFLNYLSTDNVYNVGDYGAGDGGLIAGLAAGGSISPTQAGGNYIFGSTSVPPGSYFVITCVDPANVVTESNETTNCTASSTKVTLPTDTGFHSPSANAKETSSAGDNNGYQTNPTNAYVGGDGYFAVDTDSGSNTTTTNPPTNTGKDKHRFYNYNFFIPSGRTIRGIEVQLYAKVDSITSGSPKIYVQLSWDGGATWTTTKNTPTLSTAPLSYTLGSATDTWDRPWSANDFTNANFRVRLINVASDKTRDFYLDWVAVRVHH